MGGSVPGDAPSGSILAVRGAKKHGLLAVLDRSYVRETAERYCGDLMRRYFADDEGHQRLAAPRAVE